MPPKRSAARSATAAAKTARGVRAARAWADLTAEQLADRIGASERAVQRWEAGTATPPQERRQAIADVCGVPLWLVEGRLAVGTIGHLRRRNDNGAS